MAALGRNDWRSEGWQHIRRRDMALRQLRRQCRWAPGAIDCLCSTGTPFGQGAGWKRVWRAVYRKPAERLTVVREWWTTWMCVARERRWPA